MARLETDIVAKSSFYAGIVQAYTPEELPEDMRSNGDTLLFDIEKSLSSAKDIDNGDFLGNFLCYEDGVLRDSQGELIKNVTVQNVIYKNKKLVEVGKAEFFSEYAEDPTKYCITIDEDENVYVRTHLPAGSACIVLALVPMKVFKPEDRNYLQIACRSACEQYIVDLLAFRLATLYQMSTAQGLAACMALSLNTARRTYVNHISEPDPIGGMKKLLNGGVSPSSSFERGY